MNEKGKRLPTPPDGEQKKQDPWRRPALLLIAGILFSTVTINYWVLDTVLPPLGLVFLYLALRPLRQENAGLRWAWALTAARMAYMALTCVLQATPLGGNGLGWILQFPGYVLQLGLLLALRAGLRGLCLRSGKKTRFGSLTALAAFTALVPVAAVLETFRLGVLGIATLIAWVGVAVSLVLLTLALRDVSALPYPGTPEPGGLRTAAIFLVSLPALTALVWLVCVFASVPRSAAFVPNGSAIDGMPEEIASILTPEDAGLLRDAENIRLDRMNRSFGYEQKIQVCTLTAELPQGEIALLEYFRWIEGAPVYGDGLTHWQSTHLTGVGEPSGSLVYERNGESRRSDLVSLTAERRTVGGMDCGEVLRAGIQVPPGAENTRGYVLRVVSADSGEKAVWFNCELTYLHTGLFGSVGQGRAQDRILSGGYDDGDSLWFVTEFSAWTDQP